MSNVETILLSLLVLDAIALTVLVLLQQGKGADVGAAFGSGSANTMFGSAGTTSFLTKLTAWLAIGFFIIAFGLAYFAKQRADASGTLGIPTVSTEIPAESIGAEGEDSVNSASDSEDLTSDIPALDEAEDAVGDIPVLEESPDER